MAFSRAVRDRRPGRAATSQQPAPAHGSRRIRVRQRAGKERRFQFFRVFDHLTESKCAEGVEIAAGGVHRCPPRRRGARHQAGKRTAEGRGLRITLAQEVADGRVAEKFTGLVEQRIDGGTEGDAPNWSRSVRRSRAEAQRLDGVASLSSGDLVDLLRSWSSVASQKIGTCSTPVDAVACLAPTTAVAAFSSVADRQAAPPAVR